MVWFNTWQNWPFCCSYLSDLTVLRQPPYLSRRPTEISFSNFKTFIQILIETKNILHWEQNQRIYQFHSLIKEGIGKTFRFAARAWWAGVGALDPGCRGRATSAQRPVSGRTFQCLLNVNTAGQNLPCSITTGFNELI